MYVATSEEIKEWLINKEFPGVTHMLVVSDTFNYEDYHVFAVHNVSVNPPQEYKGIYIGDIKKIITFFNSENMQRVMEVYSYSRNLEKQLQERRAWHPD